jgi:hypothetical protein
MMVLACDAGGARLRVGWALRVDAAALSDVSLDLYMIHCGCHREFAVCGISPQLPDSNGCHEHD